MKVKVHFSDDWDDQRTYTYEVPDSVEVGDEVGVPSTSVKWARVVAIGSHYNGQCVKLTTVRRDR